MSELIVEKNIQKRYYDCLKAHHPNNVLVMNWKGWMEKGGLINKALDPTHRGAWYSPFYSEFDIARFERIVKNGKYVRLILYGYEVKGVHQDKRNKEQPWKYQRVTSGLDQALTLTYQYTDYSYLITPRPERKNHETFLLDFRKKHASKVGIIFAEVDGKFTEAVPATKLRQNRKEKENSLISLFKNGKYAKGSLFTQAWCRDLMSLYDPSL
jgi:hypothetical protein